MKINFPVASPTLTPICTLFLYVSVAQISAGELPANNVAVALEETSAPLLTPTVDIRARYEYGDQENLETSHAGTLRNRLGLLTRELEGLQFFGEYEGTLTPDRDSYRGASVHGPASKTVIADPESHELNQLWGSYHALEGGLFVKAGRQAIELDNQRFVGGVAWRQNMQTYDAATITLKPSDDIELFYGYISQVNRIFGSEVTAPAQTDFTGNTHLANAKFKNLPFGTLTTYGYFLDLGNEAGDSNSNNTFGASLAGNIFSTPLSYYAEYAYQTDAFDSPLDYGANYAHGAITAPLAEGVTATAGLEYLGSDGGSAFRTPLATLHKFSGFADTFLTTPEDGLTDAYASVGTKLFSEIAASLSYHYFNDGGFGSYYGQEVDLVISKSLGNGFTALAKGAYFIGDEDLPDLARFSFEIGYKF